MELLAIPGKKACDQIRLRAHTVDLLLQLDDREKTFTELATNAEMQKCSFTLFEFLPKLFPS